jgi:hypothetical protein
MDGQRGTDGDQDGGRRKMGAGDKKRKGGLSLGFFGSNAVLL